jgi:hypothetical protein
MVSIDSGEIPANAPSAAPSISADGRIVAFESLASNLTEGDTNGVSDVFVHDLDSGTTMRVSVSSAGVQGGAGSYRPSLSPDGGYVAFESDAYNLVSGDSNQARDIFLYALETDVVTRISTDSGGLSASGASYRASVSSGGTKVAFQSDAPNLVTGDTNSATDVFVRDLNLGTLVRVSLGTTGQQGNAPSYNPSMSDDASYVAFTSRATNFGPVDTNATEDIYLRDLALAQTEPISVSLAGAMGNGDSWISSSSADGRFVAFVSWSSNLVGGDTNSVGDLFLRDLSLDRTTRVSVNALGQQSNGRSQDPAVSGGGRYVAFDSDATNLVMGDTNGVRDVFVYDDGPPATIDRSSVASDPGTEAITSVGAGVLPADAVFGPGLVDLSALPDTGQDPRDEGSDTNSARQTGEALAPNVNVATAADVEILDPDTIDTSTSAAVGTRTHYQKSLISYTGTHPPDPNIAVASNYVVATANTVATFLNVDTGYERHHSIRAFFDTSTQCSVPAGMELSDPRVIYYRYSGRFYLVIMGHNDSAKTAAIFVAATPDSSPFGSWQCYKINVQRYPDGSTSQWWADFPTVGINNRNLYIAANMLSFGSDSFPHQANLWIIPYREFGGTIHVREIPGVHGGTSNFSGPEGWDLMPALTLGWTGNNYEYMVQAWLHGRTQGQLLLWTVKCCDVVSAQPEYVYVKGWNPPPERVPAGGGRFLQIGSHDQLTQATMVDGHVWTTQTIGDASSTRSEIRVYRICATCSSLNSQSWTHGSATDSYYYSAVAPNPTGLRTVVFHRSGQNLPPAISFKSKYGDNSWSNRHTVHLSDVPPQPEPQSGDPARWGDYAGAAQSTDGSNWIFGEWVPADAPWSTYAVQVD